MIVYISIADNILISMSKESICNHDEDLSCEETIDPRIKVSYAFYGLLLFKVRELPTDAVKLYYCFVL